MYVYMYVCMQVYMYLCMYVCRYACMYVCMIYIHTSRWKDKIVGRRMEIGFFYKVVPQDVCLVIFPVERIPTRTLGTTKRNIQPIGRPGASEPRKTRSKESKEPTQGSE